MRTQEQNAEVLFLLEKMLEHGEIPLVSETIRVVKLSERQLRGERGVMEIEEMASNPEEHGFYDWVNDPLGLSPIVRERLANPE